MHLPENVFSIDNLSAPVTFETAHDLVDVEGSLIHLISIVLNPGLHVLSLFDISCLSCCFIAIKDVTVFIFCEDKVTTYSATFDASWLSLRLQQRC